MSEYTELERFEVANTIVWCHEQAESIMGLTAGAATTHGDPSGALEMANRMASDIAINLQLLAQKLVLVPTARAGGEG